MTRGLEWGAAVALLAVAGAPGWGLPAAAMIPGPATPPGPGAPDWPLAPAPWPGGQVDLVPTLARGLGLLETPPRRDEAVAFLAASLGRIAGTDDGRPAEPLAAVLAMTLWRRPVDADGRYRLAVELSATLGADWERIEPAVGRLREALGAIGLPGPDVALVETEVRRLARSRW